MRYPDLYTPDTPVGNVLSGPHHFIYPHFWRVSLERIKFGPILKLIGAC